MVKEMKPYHFIIPKGFSLYKNSSIIYQTHVTYEITCYFHAGVVAPVDINLIANGEKKFQKLRLTSAGESAERRYTVTITDERLTQVIYTRKKRWVWNGFTVKRLSKGE